MCLKAKQTWTKAAALTGILLPTGISMLYKEQINSDSIVRFRSLYRQGMGLRLIMFDLCSLVCKAERIFAFPCPRTQRIYPHQKKGCYQTWSRMSWKHPEQLDWWKSNPNHQPLLQLLQHAYRNYQLYTWAKICLGHRGMEMRQLATHSFECQPVTSSRYMIISTCVTNAGGRQINHSFSEQGKTSTSSLHHD